MKAHRTDLVSLVFGLIFAAIPAWWLVDRSLEVDSPQVGWFVAGGLILLGVLGLIGALRSGRTAEVSTPTTAPTTAPPAADAPGSPAATTASFDLEPPVSAQPTEQLPVMDTFPEPTPEPEQEPGATRRDDPTPYGR